MILLFVAVAYCACPTPTVVCNRVCPDVVKPCVACASAQAKGLQCCPPPNCGCDNVWLNADGSVFTGDCSISVVLPPLDCSCPPSTKAACEKIAGKIWLADPVVDPPGTLPGVLPPKNGKRCSCVAPIGGKCVDKPVAVTPPPITCECPLKSPEQISCEAKLGFKWVVTVKPDVLPPLPKEIPLPAPVPGNNRKRCSCYLPPGSCVAVVPDISPPKFTLPPCDCRSEDQRKCEATLGGVWLVSGVQPGGEPPKDVPLPAPGGEKVKRCSCVAPRPGVCTVKPIIEPCDCPVMTDVQNCILSGKLWAAAKPDATTTTNNKTKRCTCAAPIGRCVDPICVCPAVVTKCDENSVFVAAREASADNSVCKCELGRCVPIKTTPVPDYCVASKCLHTSTSCAAAKGLWTEASAQLTDRVFNSACGCGVCTIKKVFDVTLIGDVDLKTVLADKFTNGLNVKMTKNGVATVEITTAAGASGDGSSTDEFHTTLKASGAVSEAKLSSGELGAATEAPSHRSSSAATRTMFGSLAAVVVAALLI